MTAEVQIEEKHQGESFQRKFDPLKNELVESADTSDKAAKSEAAILDELYTSVLGFESSKVQSNEPLNGGAESLGERTAVNRGTGVPRRKLIVC